MKKLLAISVILPLLMPVMASAAVCAISGNTVADNENISGSTNEAWASPFTVAAPCLLGSGGGVFKTVGTPGDSLVLQIFTDSAGNPGTLIETSSAVAGLTSSFAHATSTFSSSNTLNTSTTYWFVARRTVPNDAVNFYSWAVNNTGGGDILKRYDGATWNNGNNGDFTFEVDSGTAVTTARPGSYSVVWW